MNDHRKMWWLLGSVLIVTFTLLGFFGREVYRKAPPIPERVVTAGGEVLMTRDGILDGQQVFLGDVIDLAELAGYHILEVYATDVAGNIGYAF